METGNQVIKVGMRASMRRLVDKHSVELFAKLTGDLNPVHFDEEAAKTNGFGGPIVHGMLMGSFFSTLIGTELPGVGSIYLGQNLKFLKPLGVGEEVEVVVEVVQLRSDKPIATLRTYCTRNGELLVEGEAVVKFGKHITAVHN